MPPPASSSPPIGQDDTCTSPRASDRPLFVKAAIMLVVLLAGLTLVYFSPLRDYLREGGGARRMLSQLGPWASLIFLLVTAALVALGLPRLILCPVAGAAFGFTRGLLYSQAGTLLGCYLAFLFVRWGGRGIVLRRWPSLQRVAVAFEQGGYLGVFLARQMPAACALINVVLALTHVRHRSFLLGTLMGILPEAIPATLLGAGIITAMDTHAGWWKMGAAVVWLLLVWLLLANYMRRSGKAELLLNRAKAFLSPNDEAG